MFIVGLRDGIYHMTFSVGNMKYGIVMVNVEQDTYVALKGLYLLVMVLL